MQDPSQSKAWARGRTVPIRQDLPRNWPPSGKVVSRIWGPHLSATSKRAAVSSDYVFRAWILGSAKLQPPRLCLTRYREKETGQRTDSTESVFWVPQDLSRGAAIGYEHEEVSM